VLTKQNTVLSLGSSPVDPCEVDAKEAFKGGFALWEPYKTKSNDLRLKCLVRLRSRRARTLHRVKFLKIVKSFSVSPPSLAPPGFFVEPEEETINTKYLNTFRKILSVNLELDKIEELCLEFFHKKETLLAKLPPIYDLPPEKGNQIVLKISSLSYEIYKLSKLAGSLQERKKLYKGQLSAYGQQLY